eukprot:TRINITY_DN9553_c0_g1_i8.p2 TRINITY_DN9553_c0_g1~~TRINITY_DN9553_c0_g1_i8.p2  ORF type:complete len:153 (-),score=15.22 TRINITY_DN9553_c0_g1_i8:425-883(-)
MSSANAFMREVNEDKLSEEGGSTDSDLSDIGLCTVSRHEYQYNSMLCHLFNREYEKAYECATSIIENGTVSYVNRLWTLRGVILSLLSKTAEAQLDFQEAINNDPSSQSFLKDRKPFTLQVFPEQSRLCARFPHIEFACEEFPSIVSVRVSV